MNKIPKKSTVRPKTREKLCSIIKEEIKKNGHACDLNYVDVSLITDFCDLFLGSEFNGDISRWDVSGASNMKGMFALSEFNGDISSWDVSGVVDMKFMFSNSKFSGDISNWNTSSLANSESMFVSSRMAEQLKAKNPSLEKVKSYFINLKLEANLNNTSSIQGKVSKVRL